MPFEADSQDSRDPNSPQWGYLKVSNPKTELQYPAQDSDWNEYVLFVHDQENPDLCLKEEVLRPVPGGGAAVIEAESRLKCVMVPATLSINYGKDDVIARTQEARDKCKDPKTKARYDKYLKRLNDSSIPAGPIDITIGGKEVPDNANLWVALVVGTPDP